MFDIFDPWVQLIRNALCCIKDWELFNDTILFDPAHTALYYTFPQPLDQTTPLEIIISVTQFYAFVSVSRSGYKLMTSSGLFKLRRVLRLLEVRANMKGVEKKATTADRIVNQSLAREGNAAIRSIFLGVNVFAIGVSFFWLFANSLHVTATSWIGGLAGLIHALTVMEIGLVPILYYMLQDGSEAIQKSARMKKLSKTLAGGKLGGMEDTLTAETYGWIIDGGWSPFWSAGTAKSADDDVTDEKMLTKEVEAVQTNIDTLVKSTEKVESAAVRLEGDAWWANNEGYREYLYFVMNFVAFYGYLLGILCYYFDEEDLQPSYVGSLKFGLSNADADWRGNFAGDFMWTVEPAIILGSPMLMGWMKPKIDKVKAA